MSSFLYSVMKVNRDGVYNKEDVSRGEKERKITCLAINGVRRVLANTNKTASLRVEMLVIGRVSTKPTKISRFWGLPHHLPLQGNSWLVFTSDTSNRV